MSELVQATQASALEDLGRDIWAGIGGLGDPP